MIGGQLPTDQQMKIMAEQLRGRDARAMLATLSGDTALTNVGKLMSGRTDKLATGLAKTRETLEGRAYDEEQRKILAGATKTERDRAYERGVLEHTMDAEAKRVRDAELDALQREEIEATYGYRKDTREAAAKKDLDSSIQKLQAEVTDSKLPAMEQDVIELDRHLGQFMDVNTGELKENIPGAGGSRINPLELLGQGKKTKRLFQRIMNRLLKERSGAAVTAPELERMKIELAQNPLSTDQDFADAYMGIKQYVETLNTYIYGGYSDDVVDKYRARISKRRQSVNPRSDGAQTGNVGVVSSQIVDDGED